MRLADDLQKTACFGRAIRFEESAKLERFERGLFPNLDTTRSMNTILERFHLLGFSGTIVGLSDMREGKEKQKRMVKSSWRLCVDSEMAI